jgi:hypothetical protein
MRRPKAFEIVVFDQPSHRPRDRVPRYSNLLSDELGRQSRVAKRRELGQDPTEAPNVLSQEPVVGRSPKQYVRDHLPLVFRRASGAIACHSRSASSSPTSSRSRRHRCSSKLRLRSRGRAPISTNRPSGPRGWPGSTPYAARNVRSDRNRLSHAAIPALFWLI